MQNIIGYSFTLHLNNVRTQITLFQSSHIYFSSESSRLRNKRNATTVFDKHVLIIRVLWVWDSFIRASLLAKYRKIRSNSKQFPTSFHSFRTLNTKMCSSTRIYHTLTTRCESSTVRSSMLNAILESFNVNFFRKSIPRATTTTKRERERERGRKINTEKMMERR